MEIQDILEKVSTLYRKYGIKSITMDDVARELGISKKTLYQFVTDKTDLVQKVVEHVKQCHFVQVIQKPEIERNAIEDLIEVSLHLNAISRDHSASYYYDLKKYYPDVYKNLMTVRRKFMYESMLANIRKGKKEGLFRKGLDEKIIARLHLLRIENLQDTEIFEEDETHSSKFFKEVFVYHIHGLATQKGLRVLDENMHKINLLDNTGS